MTTHIKVLGCYWYVGEPFVNGLGITIRHHRACPFADPESSMCSMTNGNDLQCAATDKPAPAECPLREGAHVVALEDPMASVLDGAAGQEKP